MSLFAPPGTSSAKADQLVVTDGYVNRPDDGPFRYFPTRPCLQEGMAEMASALERLSNASGSVCDAILDELSKALRPPLSSSPPNFQRLRCIVRLSRLVIAAWLKRWSASN